MHIALPNLGLIAVVPPNTAGQPESTLPTDTVWAEAMLLDMEEVTVTPVAVPLALTLPLNPEAVALAPIPENALPVPALFVVTNLPPLEGEVSTPLAVAPEVGAEVDQTMPADPPPLETAEVAAPASPLPFALNPEIGALTVILRPESARPLVSENTSETSERSTNALQADVVNTKPHLNVADLDGKAGNQPADPTHAAPVPISMPAIDTGTAAGLLPLHFQTASAPTVATSQGGNPPEVIHLLPTSEAAKLRIDQTRQIDVAEASGLDAFQAFPHLTPQPKPTPKQGLIAVAAEAAVQQASPAQIMLATPPKMPIQIVMHTQNPARIVSPPGSLGETIALGWSLRQGQFSAPTAVATIKDLQAAPVADTPQFDPITAEPGQTLPEQPLPDQSLPVQSLLEASAPANEPPTLAATIAPIAATTSLVTTDPSPVRDIAPIDVSHDPARAEDVTASPTQPSPVQQAKAAVLAQAMTETPGQIDLTLTPDDLGALRFEMKPEATGMAITLSAERPETLDLMRRNVADLIAELKDAGVVTGSFSFGTWSDRQPPPARPLAGSGEPLADIRPAPPQPHKSRPMVLMPGGLDLRF